MDSRLKKSSPVALAIAWAIVVLPLLWGLTYTVRNALKIFSAAPAQTISRSMGAIVQGAVSPT